MRILLRRFLFPFLLLALPLTAGAQAVWHVDAQAPTGGNGTSWSQAFDTIEGALAVAIAGDSIWVKTGVYTPQILEDPLDPRSATFLLTHGVKLYGGFDGTELTLADRAGLFYRTILSGDVGVPGVAADNAYHVIHMTLWSGTPAPETTIDGFTICDGNASASRKGGALRMEWANLIIGNCTFQDNYAYDGGAIGGMGGWVVTRWCTFTYNHASHNGGALWGQVTVFKTSNCQFDHNEASKGGCVFLTQSLNAPWGPRDVFLNSSFRDNMAVEGGAIFLAASTYGPGRAFVSNCTVVNNTALTRGGGVCAKVVAGSNPGDGRVENTIVWGNRAPTGPNVDGNATVSYSDVEGGIYVGNGNISADPLFVNAAGADFRLQAGSPANDAGSNSLLRQDRADVDFDDIWDEEVPLDLDGGRRRADDPLAPDTGAGTAPIVDMGAFEY